MTKVVRLRAKIYRYLINDDGEDKKKKKKKKYLKNDNRKKKKKKKKKIENLNLKKLKTV